MHSLRHLVTATAFVLPLAAHAQNTTTALPRRSPDVGARVLVTLAKAEGYEPSAEAWKPVMPPHFTGRVVRVTSDSLWVQPHPSVSAVSVPQGEVRHLFVSGGRPRGRAMAWGAANGAVLGASMGWAAYSPLFQEGQSRQQRGQVLAVYAASGVITGVIFGAMFPAERWRRVR